MMTVCLIKKTYSIVTELVTSGRKLDISLAFVTQSYFTVPKNARLSSTHYFFMKIRNKQEVQQTAFNDSTDIDYQKFIDQYKKCTFKTMFFFSCLC